MPRGQTTWSLIFELDSKTIPSTKFNTNAFVAEYRVVPVVTYENQINMSIHLLSEEICTCHSEMGSACVTLR